MSSSTQYATPGVASLRRARRGARVEERVQLNLPEFDDGTRVRAFVEDTSARRVRRHSPPSPRLTLRITECTSQIHLELSIDSHDLRGNSLHKIETLIAWLGRFRDGLRAEAQLRAACEDGSRARNGFVRGAL
jgi:hypothetical protein